MANKFARSNGNFDGPIWALTSSGVAGSTTAPTIGDNAVANTFTVQITGNVACDNITNGNNYGGTAGGLFNLQNLSQMTSNVIGQNLSQPTLILSGTNSSSVFGNLTPTGGQLGGHCISFTSSGTLTFAGNTFGSGLGCAGILNSGIGSVLATGNCFGSSSTNNPGAGISNTSTGSVTVYGNLNGSTASALSNTSTGSVTVVGNVISDSRGGAGIASSNAAANVRISGNLIGAPNGIPAVYAASYTVNPVPYQTYIRYANNGTGVGSDAYLYHYTTDSLSAFSMPPLSAVRAGLQYANNTLTGTCEIPAASAVTFGALVDNTLGTAALTNNTLFDVSVTSLTATDSLGARLKNSATVESVGRIIASFSN
jgi:hypothetical protein